MNITTRFKYQRGKKKFFQRNNQSMTFFNFAFKDSTKHANISERAKSVCRLAITRVFAFLKGLDYNLQYFKVKVAVHAMRVHRFFV